MKQPPSQFQSLESRDHLSCQIYSPGPQHLSSPSGTSREAMSWLLDSVGELLEAQVGRMDRGRKQRWTLGV